MKSRPVLISVIIVTVLLVIGVGIVMVLMKGNEEQKPGPDVTFPGGGGLHTGGPLTATIELPLQNGDTVTVSDFIRNGVTIEDPANEGVYYLAGSSGVCNSDGTCPAAGTQ